MCYIILNFCEKNEKRFKAETDNTLDDQLFVWSIARRNHYYSNITNNWTEVYFDWPQRICMWLVTIFCKYSIFYGYVLRKKRLDNIDQE